MSSQPVTPWSFTRRRTAAECERRYYWDYIGTRRGAYASPDSMARFAWAMKQTAALPLLAGTAVHTAARQLAMAIREGQPEPGYDELRAGAALTMNTTYVNTSRRLDRWWQAPGAFPIYREVISRGVLDADDLARTRGRLERALRNLCAAPVLNDLRQCGPGEIVLTDTIARARVTDAPGQAGATAPATGDIEVMGQLDLLYLHHDPTSVDDVIESATWCIVDFKTGKTDIGDLRLQLGGYAVLLRGMGVPMTDGAYLGRVVCLDDNSEVVERITEADLVAALAVMESDAQRSRALVARSAGTTSPVEEVADTYRVADRPHRACPGCAYLPLCTASLGRRPWERPRPETVPSKAAPPHAGAGASATSAWHGGAQ